MTSALYLPWKQELMKGTTSPPTALTGTTQAVLVDTGTYTFSYTHSFYTSLSGIAQTSGPADAKITIDNKSYTNGVFDTSDATDEFVSLTQTSTNYEALVIFIDASGVAGNSRLVAFIDGFAAITPNGGNVIINWDSSTDLDPSATNSAGGIFAL